MNTKRVIVIVVGLAMLPWVSQSAFAKVKKNKNAPQQQPTQQPATPAPKPAPPANTSAVTAAQKEVADARAALAAATKKAEAAFETSPEYVAADKQVKDDQAAYDAAVAPIVAKMQNDPGYIDAKTKSEKTQTELADLRSNSAPEDQVTAKLQEAMDAKSAMHKIESAAMAADPGVTEAHTKLMDAEKAKAALVAQFHAKLSENPDYAAAKSALDAATQKLAAAQKS